MALYTVILEYRGGTYSSQVTAESPRAALLSWATNLEASEIKHLGTSGKQRLIAGLKNDPIDRPVLLTGLRNVWCYSGPISSMLIYIVRTESATT